ncbi:intracellular septation protein [Polynucleobacter kasalickyi]|uniref:Inner membrane-spanning protein YciB n=1 Tax=Polynucleobacter kasalickyi TaxID=1938817 RepID=A0A1W2BGP2_9BURK|nr:intracellular septation protein [Polynucleobacter kasalickyi]
MIKLLLEILPIVAFFVAFKLFDIFTATAVAMAISVLQILWLKLRKHEVPKMQWFNLIIIMVFGGLTLVLHDESFIMIKPTILYWSFAAVLAISWFGFKKNLIKAVLGKEIALRPAVENEVWFKLNLGWVIYFVILGILNLWIAYNFSKDTWADFKLSTIGLLFIFVICQGVWLSKHMDHDSTNTPNQ